MGSVSLCRDEDNSSPHLPCQADPLSGSDGCCLVPLLSPGGGSPTAVVSSGTRQRLIPPHDLLPAQCLGSPRGPLGARPGCYGGALAELLPGASAVVTEARGPFGARHRWSLWIDGRWPYPETRIPGGSRPVGSAVRRRCPRGLDPSSEGHMPQPASAFTGAWSDPLRADWCWRSLVGAIGWFQRPPGTPGVPP
ncbi:hypothetical protein N7530_010720 [Penicillium desertorum]|uniref:Uncharacterized protein n=1 Tax=Penicillium desertorum TaxID=1303715 RepID=A0A9W9WGB1_9EURO|nr:hypothetical protein N7530_010720 [Penicillium desertorum]